nr:histone-like nucleoid-structuring protein, MvaT/MvaU family [uncultured Pseudomonas sp.]
MSKLAELRQLEQSLAVQLEAIEALKCDAGLKQEVEFERRLRELLEKYDKDLGDILELFGQGVVENVNARGTSSKAKRRPRVVKFYKNPHNNEIVHTKGGNHKVLKQWKTEYGARTVESWFIKNGEPHNK